MGLENDPSAATKAADTLGQAQYNFPAGFVRVTDEPTQLFYDPFDAALDTVNRWNAAVSAGGGVAASVTAGSLTFGTGTTINGYSTLSSQALFTPTVPSWLGESHAIKLEFPITTNAYRFWGHGTVPATPTAALPLTDAFGFEIGTDGKLYAVVYIAGARNVIQDFSAATGNAKQPTDALYHRYICYYRTDKIFFYIDTLDTPVATANFISPASQILPHRFLAIAGTSAPSSSGVINCTGLAVWDTGKNNYSLSDGTFGWRKATVKPASQAALATDPALVVAISPNNTVPVSFAEATVLFKGRVSTFRTPGRAGTTGQKILSLHNATGSTVTVTLNKVAIDLYQTVVKLITVPPPIVRLWKVTVLPTNGTALTKVKIGGTSTSSASVTVLQDASVDGTNSATALTATLPAGTVITQEYAPRFITAAGYEMADRMEFLGDTKVTLAALEGVVLFLDYTVATSNPTTDMWIANIEWTET